VLKSLTKLCKKVELTNSNSEKNDYHLYNINIQLKKKYLIYAKSAEQGNKEAFIRTMELLRYDNFKDYTDVIKWCEKVASQGDVEVQVILGNVYNNIFNELRDESKAAKWYEKAALQGNAEAQHKLGMLYLFGDGVTIDYTEAIKWFQKSDGKYESESLNKLGFMYENGYGVAKSNSEAMKWYQKAADNGNEDAKKALQRLQ
jgi:FOG: TPR repeat, SEL1 subfamily